MPLSASEKVEKARLAVKQAKARLQAIENRQSEAERKLETRRKIILGGLLIDAAGKDERFAKVVTALIGRISRDHDRQAFDSWETPVPPLPSAPLPAPAPAEATSTP